MPDNALSGSVGEVRMEMSVTRAATGQTERYFLAGFCAQTEADTLRDAGFIAHTEAADGSHA